MKRIALLLFLLLFLLCGINASAYEQNPSGYIVKLKETSDIRLFSVPGTKLLEDYYYVDSREALQRLIRQNLVCEYEPDAIVRLFEAPNDPNYHLQWNLEAVGQPFSYALGAFGETVRVGVIDSGLYAQHSDLNPERILPGYNYLDRNTDTSDPADAAASSGHGTAVTGIISAETDNGLGCSGISDRVEIVPLKCFRNGETLLSNIVLALNEAVTKYHCQVINMSFGLENPSSAFKTVVERAEANGVILVAAAGNDGSSTLFYPAAYSTVIGVGSVGRDGTVSDFSQKNESVAICAPGDQILCLSNLGENEYLQNSGTSFSAPHITAFAAIAKSICPDMTPAEFRQLLSETAAYSANEYGTLDIESGIRRLLEGKPFYRSPVTIRKSGGIATAKIGLYNPGPEVLSAQCSLGLFRQNQLVSLKNNLLQLPAGSAENIALSYPADREDGIIRCFLFRDWESLMPLAPALSVNHAE